MENVSRSELLSKDFSELLKRLGVYRRRIGFSALRPTFRTWADEAKDDDACKLIMGHEIPGMDGTYIQQIGHDRIEAVTTYVRNKLFT